MDCGCDKRKETMFLEGRAGGLDVALLFGVPLGVVIYLWIRSQ